MPSPFDPIEYVQWRTDCTGDDITAWCAIMNEPDEEVFGVPSYAAAPTYIASLPRRTGPCLGCGRPTGDVFEKALTLTGIDTPAPTATFHPCGCVLKVRIPPILDHIPDGTFPIGRTAIPLHEQIAERITTDPELMASLHARLTHQLHRRPDVVILMDAAEAKARNLPGPYPKRRKLLVAYTLHARPGTTEWIVVRADREMPPGFMPPGLDGKWQERASMPFAAPVFEGLHSRATAHPTGRVEIREDGAIAEVYEMRHP